MAINQFQMTGDVYVVVRSIGASTINGTNYTDNEVIASFTADVNLNFGTTDTVATTSKTQLARTSTFAQSLTVVPKILNDGVYNLISNRLTGDISVPVITTKTSNGSGAIYLNSEIDSTFLIIKDSNNSKVTGYSVDNAAGTITGLSNDTEYKLYYYEIKTPVTSLQFEDIAIPYVKMELIGKGNINNENKGFLVTIPKVQVDGSPQLTFNNTSIINVVLECDIINLDKVTMHYY
jgi:hypothetical protein